MKKLAILLTLLIIFAHPAMAQTYDIVGGSQGKDGAYMVKVWISVKDPKGGEDLLRECAVKGVLFRGFKGEKPSNVSQDAIISDPAIQQSQAAFFNSFFSRGDYRNYATMVKLSYKSIKESKKGYRISAQFLVDKESLINHLEKSGVIKGFSNLW